MPQLANLPLDCKCKCIRCQRAVLCLSRAKATALRRLKARDDQKARRHSLRLSPMIKQVKARPIIRATGMSRTH